MLSLFVLISNSIQNHFKVMDWTPKRHWKYSVQNCTKKWFYPIRSTVTYYELLNEVHWIPSFSIDIVSFFVLIESHHIKKELCYYYYTGSLKADLPWYYVYRNRTPAVVIFVLKNTGDGSIFVIIINTTISDKNKNKAFFERNIPWLVRNKYPVTQYIPVASENDPDICTHRIPRSQLDCD